MSVLDIDSALIQAYIDIGLGLSTAYENVKFTPPTDGTAWAAVFVVPAPIDTFTLGSNGSDLHLGFMQVDFNVPHNTGRATLMGYFQSLRDEFVAGKAYTSNSQTVNITTVDRSPVREADGWTTLSVTVNFQAETIRPTF